MRMMRATTRPCLQEIALASGYCNQAHMNLDFRALAGNSPSQLAD